MTWERVKGFMIHLLMESILKLLLIFDHESLKSSYEVPSVDDFLFVLTNDGSKTNLFLEIDKKKS